MPRRALVEEKLTGSVIGAFFGVYNTLGFGFLEQVYATALERELSDRGHRVAREVYVQVNYRGCVVAAQRLDMLIEDRLIVEIKSTVSLHYTATRQVYNYLRATRLEIALLLHFGPKPHFHRIICLNARKDPLHPPDP